MLESLTKLRVRYADTDMMGFCYYANYLRWFEIGRTEMLRENGLPYAEIEQQGYALPVLEAHCKYHKPAYYDEQVTITSRLRERARATLKIEYEVHNASSELLATGYTTHTFITKKGKAARPPQVFREFIKRHFGEKS